jgi:hypothetical protein
MSLCRRFLYIGARILHSSRCGLSAPPGGLSDLYEDWPAIGFQKTREQS